MDKVLNFYMKDERGPLLWFVPLSVGLAAIVLHSTFTGISKEPEPASEVSTDACAVNAWNDMSNKPVPVSVPSSENEIPKARFSRIMHAQI